MSWWLFHSSLSSLVCLPWGHRGHWPENLSPGALRRGKKGFKAGKAGGKTGAAVELITMGVCLTSKDWVRSHPRDQAVKELQAAVASDEDEWTLRERGLGRKRLPALRRKAKARDP